MKWKITCRYIGCFKTLRQSEIAAISRRLSAAKSELARAESAEESLQQKYSELKSELSAA